MARPQLCHRLCVLGLWQIIMAALVRDAAGSLMFDRVDSDNACLLAMCDVDSGCVPVGCSVDQNDRIGCGYFNLNIYQFRQCYQPGKQEDEDEEIAWIHCAENYDCSAQCIKTVANKFRVKCYGKSDCEAMARIHDGGANGCRSRDTAFYWKRVRDSCADACKKSIFRRH